MSEVPGDDELGVVEELAGPADLGRLDGAVLRLEVLVVDLEVLGLQVERPDDPGSPARGTGRGPVELLPRRHPVGGHHRLHRLAQRPVGEDHDRGPVALGDLEGVGDEVDRLGDR